MNPIALNCVINHKERGIQVSLLPQKDEKSERKQVVPTRYIRIPRERVTDKSRGGLSLGSLWRGGTKLVKGVVVGTAGAVSGGVQGGAKMAGGLAMNVGTSLFGFATFFDIIKELLCSVLKAMLGDYIENFDLEQLTFGIWGGKKHCIFLLMSHTRFLFFQATSFFEI